MLEYNAAHEGPVCSLNLWLPTAQLHSRQDADTVLTALQSSFDQLVEQVKKHKQVLRREDVWKRRRYRFQQEARELEAAEVHPKDRLQLRDYLDQVLPQLERFITRELRFRELEGELQPGHAQKEEIIDEVVARALENVQKTASNSVPFHYVLGEAIRVLNGPPEPANSSAGNVETSRLWRPGRVAGNGPETRAPQPSDAVEQLLASMSPIHRQVYVLHALEGFGWEETAQVLELSASGVAEIFRQVSREVSAVLQEDRASARVAPEARS
jgi:DNA-directed RNA polymerase specialized sigma24 family protein